MVTSSATVERPWGRIWEAGGGVNRGGWIREIVWEKSGREIRKMEVGHKTLPERQSQGLSGRRFLFAGLDTETEGKPASSARNR
jgi:hypothetical protein